MSKRIKKSYASLLSLILVSSSVFSCDNNSITTISNVEKNQEFKVGNGSGSVKVNLNINTNSNTFKTKASENGVAEKTKASNLTKVTLVLSNNAVDPYNNPTGTSLDITTGLTSFPKGLTISGLDPNKTYYLAAKAFEGGNNITEGDTVVSNEQVEVLVNGAINMLNDTNTNNIWDISLKLLDGKGASIDSEIYFENGNKGNFDTKEEKVNTDLLSTNQTIPRVSINDNGNGLVVYETVEATGIENIVGRFISDYRLDAPEFLIDSNTISNSFARFIEHPAIQINNKGNGLLVWNEEDNGSEIMKYRKIENYKPIGSELNLDSLEFKQKHYPTIGFQNKLVGTQRSAIVVWRKESANPNYDLKAKIFRTSNNDFSGSMTSSSEIKINNGTNELNTSIPQVSQIGESNKCMLVWTKHDGSFNRIRTKVLSLDSNATPGFVNPTPDTDPDIIISQNGSHKGLNPSISLNDMGDGLIVWEEGNSGKKIYYKRVTNYGFDNDSGSPIGFRISSSSSPLDETFPKVSLDQNGNGLVVWTDLRSFPNKIYGRKIIGYEPVGSDFRIGNDSVYELISDLDINENLNGFIAWEKSNTGFSDFDIYSRRILKTNPE
jgi:hypothetical protein